MAKQLIRLLKTSRTTQDFYREINRVFKEMTGEYHMLHYPLYRGAPASLLQAQKNLTDHCLEQVQPVEGQTVLDIGCGNGVQTHYVHRQFTPGKLIGIDLNDENIAIANGERDRLGHDNVVFHVANAQEISPIEDESIDVVYNIESAMHYPDKAKFLREIHRVLKPGGRFVIADELKKGTKHRRWEKRLNMHYWNMDLYEQGFQQANLNTTSVEDITPDVIEGFRQHKHWFDGYEPTSAISRFLALTWVKIYTDFAAFLLKAGHTYMMFTGEKAMA